MDRGFGGQFRTSTRLDAEVATGPDRQEFASLAAQPGTTPPTAVPFRQATGCRYIHGTAGLDAPTCNAKRVPGTAWCPDHLARVYLPPRRR
jgi:hypothetical protein